MSKAIERLQVATAAQGANSATQSLTFLKPRSTTICVISVYLKDTTTQVSAVAWGSGTFVLAHRQVGTTTAIETWVGYDFDDTDTDTTATVTLTAAHQHWGLFGQTFSNGAVHTAAPTVSAAVGATGTTSPFDPGSVTPTAGDETQLVYEAVGWANITASTFTHTPGGLEQGYFATSGSALTGGRISAGYRNATSTSAHKVTGTVTAGVEWVAHAMLITPTESSPVADSVQVYKGRQTSTLDNAAVA